jgi:hypothetical protein
MNTSRRSFTLRDYLERRFAEDKPALPCNARTQEEFERWRGEFTRQLEGSVGKLPKTIPLRPETMLTISLPGIRAEKIVFDSNQFMSVPAWVLIPSHLKSGERRPAVCLIPGHSGEIHEDSPGKIVDETSGKAWAVGLNPDGSPCGTRYHNDLAQELVRAGFIVYCADMLGFGERASDPYWARNRWVHVCDLHAEALRYFGLELTVIHLHDLQRGLDYLQTRGDVDATRLAAAGCSLGGVWAGYLAALDARIQAAAVINSYPNTIAKFLAQKCGVCGAQVIPGSGRIGDDSDLLCAVAPRPLLLQFGDSDPGMSLTDLLEPARKVQAVYAMLGHPDACRVDVFKGGHEIRPPAILQWLKGAL